MIKEEIPVMEASISHGSVRRSRETDFVTSGTGKRRRFGSQDEEDDFRRHYDGDVNFHENVVSTAVSANFDHVNSSFTDSVNDDSISDPKDECVAETGVFVASTNVFSRETSTSSAVVCLESEAMESLSTSTLKKKKKSPAATTANEATSRRKPPPVEMMPCAAEIEEFFSKAEKYEQKRFAEKYNFDIVKDIPMEGRYQWVELKP